MNLKICFLAVLSVLLIVRPAFASDQSKDENDINDETSVKEEGKEDGAEEEPMIEEELTEEELEKLIKIEYLNKVDNCKKKGRAPDFLSVHFTSKWLKDGETILTTSDRNVPIEIQLGTKMLSLGVDFGLNGICIGEKRRITLPARIGIAGIEYDKKRKDELITYDLELVGISDKMTLATFYYLDLNNDGKVSVKEAENLIKMFLNSLTTLLPSFDLKQLLSFFLAMHDTNGDGMIDMNEFLSSISSLNVKDEL